MRPLVALSVLASACSGGAEAKPAPPPAVAPVASASASAAKPPPAPAYEDPDESAEPIALDVLVQRGAKIAYPKATTSDPDCWKDMPLTGDHQKDFDALVGRCGAPTGMVEYTKPKVGRVHHEHDERDTFVMKVQKGLCYRIFAVGDGDVKNMDIRITRPDGALLEDDKTKSPAAIIHNASPWCADADEALHFHVKVVAPSKGRYFFGAWVRPDRK